MERRGEKNWGAEELATTALLGIKDSSVLPLLSFQSSPSTEVAARGTCRRMGSWYLRRADANLEAVPWICSPLAQRIALQTKSYFYEGFVYSVIHEVEKKCSKRSWWRQNPSTKWFFLFQRRITIRFSKILSSLLCCRPQAQILTPGFSNLSWSISPSLGTDHTHLCMSP